MLKRLMLSLVLVLILPMLAFSAPIVLNFDSFSDGDVLSNQILGLTFTNAMILSAGFSLNEVDFPPYSGANVLIDLGGPMRIDFSTLVLSFSGFFTYTGPITLQGFDSANNLVASVSSAFSNNTVGFGGVPNELVGLNFAGGIQTVLITGDSAGFSFTLDDATYDEVSQVPEPGSLLLVSLGCVFAGAVYRRHQGTIGVNG